MVANWEALPLVPPIFGHKNLKTQNGHNPSIWPLIQKIKALFSSIWKVGENRVSFLFGLEVIWGIYSQFLWFKPLCIKKKSRRNSNGHFTSNPISVVLIYNEYVRCKVSLFSVHWNTNRRQRTRSVSKKANGGFTSQSISLVFRLSLWCSAIWFGARIDFNNKCPQLPFTIINLLKHLIV